MGAPTDNIEDDNDDDYEYQYPDSSCGDDDVEHETSKGNFFVNSLDMQLQTQKQNGLTHLSVSFLKVSKIERGKEVDT